MDIETTKTIKAAVGILKINMKVSDRFAAQLISAAGEVVHDQEDGYVPDFMPGTHYGDYVMLNIDITTGQITNWQVPSPEQIQEWINPEDD